MELIRIDVESKDFEIPLWGDVHRGAKNFHKSLFNDFIASVSEGEKYLLNMGDNIEAITVMDKRYSYDATLSPKIDDQMDMFVESVLPIKDRIHTIALGNHEAKLSNEFNIGAELAKRLDASYGGYVYVTQFFYKDKRLFSVFCHHGWGTMIAGAKDPIQRRANRLAWLKRRLERTGISDCVVMAMGHTHQLLIQEPTIRYEKCLAIVDDQLHQFSRPDVPQYAEYISPERRWYINTGSFLKLYSQPGSGFVNYAERAMLEPADLGWIELVVRDGCIVDVVKKEG